MTFAEIAERRNRLDPYSDDEERFKDAVLKAWDRGYSAEEIAYMTSESPSRMCPVGRILTIIEEAE